MADTKITGLASLAKGAVDPEADELVIVDDSDVTMGATGTNKRIIPHALVTDSVGALKYGDAGAGPFDHIRWTDQSGQGHAPLTLNTQFGSFSGASFTVTGDTDGTTAVLTNVTPIARIVVGMTITGTGIPGGATVASIDSATQITISAATTSSGTGTTLTLNAGGAAVKDPVLSIGYNIDPGGNHIDVGRGQAYMQIEGHYDRGATGDVWMEAFFAFKGPTASGACRPFFFAYDPETNKPQTVSCAPGVGKSFFIYFEDVTGGSGGDATVKFSEENAYFLRGPLKSDTQTGTTTSGSAVVTGLSDTADLTVGWAVAGVGIPWNATILTIDSSTQITMSQNAAATGSRTLQFGDSSNKTLRLDSVAGGVSSFQMGCDGDNMATNPTAVWTTGTAGANSEHRSIALGMYDQDSQKTGKVSYIAHNSANAVMTTFGMASASSSSLVHMSNENLTTGYPVLTIKPIASQTRGLIECDTINNGTGAIEARGWQVHPKGYVQVRESGNVSTNRDPGTGSATTASMGAPAAWNNKPGSNITSTVPDKWFPMLDTVGALFWVPGFADA